MVMPCDPMALSPKEFEELALGWLKTAGDTLGGLVVKHRDVRHGASGDYEIDVSLEFEAFGGAKFVVLVECKRHRRRIEREPVMVLKAKLDDLGAHKGIICSTAGFQAGALKYAEVHGIATVHVRDGSSHYQTRAREPVRELPSGTPPVVGWFGRPGDEPGTSKWSVVTEEHTDSLREWLKC